MKITVVGAGFVGLTTALGLCDKGHHATCIDVDASRAEMLNRGEPPFFEPGLEALLKQELASGRFKASTDLANALDGSEISIICVGTPSTDKGIDLSYVKQAAKDIGEVIKGFSHYHVVTVKSTVVPGSVDTAVKSTLETATGKTCGVEFGVAMNPEFLREGCAVHDFTNPDRIVIGADDNQSAELLQQLYKGFDCPIIITSARNAEMIKYTANSLMATLISYANEITNICETIPGLSEEVVMNGVFEDKRFWCADTGSGNRLRPEMISYLRGGIGFGGSCFPKDVKALLKYANHAGYTAPLLNAVLDINTERSNTVVKRLADLHGGSLQGKTICVLGLAFKPDTDDLRESPALRVIQSLQAAGAKIVTHDPVVKPEALLQATGIDSRFEDSIDKAVNKAHGAVIATAWNEYKKADWSSLAQYMETPIIFDGRQVIDEIQRGKGFVYLQTGSTETIGDK